MAAVKIDVPCTIRVRIPASDARSRRSTWVVAIIGSPGTRKPTRFLAACLRSTTPDSTSSRWSTVTGFPIRADTFSMVVPRREEV